MEDKHESSTAQSMATELTAVTPRKWSLSPRIHPEPQPEQQPEDLPTLASHQADQNAEPEQQARRPSTADAPLDSEPSSPGLASDHAVEVEGGAKSMALLVARSVSKFFEDDKGVVDKWHLRQNSCGSMSQSGGLKGSGGSSLGLGLATELTSFTAREAKLIAKQYSQGLLVSMSIAAFNVVLVYALSRMTWHQEHPGERPAFTLDSRVYQLSLLLQLIFPLCFYALILYVCIKGSWHVPRTLFIFVLTVMSLAIIVAMLFWKYDVPFWFYSGDFFTIALTYVPAMCAVGWFLAEEGATRRARLMDLLMVALLETVVAAAAILYCQLLMPLYFMVNAWLQLAWVCILHPVYFEVTTAILLRIVLRRNAIKGRTDVKWFLSIVHAAVHSVSISSILTSSIDSLGVTILTQVLCSAAKLVWRSTTNLRDVWVERAWRRDWSFTYGLHEQSQQNRLVATGILTEMILENACNVLAPWLIWCTWHVPLFMSVAPNTLVDGGTYPVYYVLCLIMLLVTVTAVFDLIFLYLNYTTGQQLPVIQTFREMRRAGAWYFGFLAYALTFMGIMFLFITMILVPRAVFCTSNNYCDCHVATLQGICDGEYISTWGGNII